MLELKNAAMAVSGLDDDEKATITISDTGNGGRDKRVIISEAGLYSLILRSRKPEAKQFKRWVFDEVLPQIRKTGGYIPTDENLNEAKIIVTDYEFVLRNVGW